MRLGRKRNDRGKGCSPGKAKKGEDGLAGKFGGTSVLALADILTRLDVHDSDGGMYLILVVDTLILIFGADLFICLEKFERLACSFIFIMISVLLVFVTNCRLWYLSHR